MAFPYWVCLHRIACDGQATAHDDGGDSEIMAGQDFAHNAAPSRKSSENPATATSILPTVAILFIAGACFAGGYWLGAADIQQTGSKTDIDAVEAHLAIKDAKLKLQQAHIESLEALVKKWKDKANQGAHAKVGELRFYNELPKKSVMPAPVTATPVIATAARPAVKSVSTPKPHSTAVMMPRSNTAPVEKASKKDIDSTAYRIQIASFRSHSDAVPMQQKLRSAGYPAFIHAVNLPDKGQWFRVYAGPFTSKAMAQEKQHMLEQSMKIKGLLIRGR